MTDKAAAGKKGPNMTMPEDKEMAKAFVATSEDNVVGSNQKSADFKAKMLLNHNDLVTKHNRLFAQQRVLGSNQNSLFSRLKGHSRMALKMIGIEETMGDPPSGDSDRERFNQLVKDTWTKRNPDDAKLVETIWVMRIVLSKHPKWRKFQTDENASDEAKKKKHEANEARPEGSKKAKQAEKDKKIIESLASSVSVASKSANKEAVTKVGNSLDFLSKGDGQICLFHGFLLRVLCLLTGSLLQLLSIRSKCRMLN